MSAPPIVRIIDKNGQAVDAYTVPRVGSADPSQALPVVLALGVAATRRFFPIPILNRTNSDTIAATVIQIAVQNPNRRYLKIYNNGNYDVEIWTGNLPALNECGQALPQGEILFNSGGAILESDTCRTSALFASCAGGTTGLVVLEG